MTDNITPYRDCAQEMTVQGHQSNQFTLSSTDDPIPHTVSAFASSEAGGGFYRKGTTTHKAFTDDLDGVVVSGHICQYGEDTTFVMTFSDPDGPTLAVQGIFDGHGNNLLASHTLCRLYTSAIREKYKSIIGYMLSDHYKLRRLLRSISCDAETGIGDTVRITGGSTMTIVFTVESGEDRVVTSMNVGDSSVYMGRIKDGESDWRIQMISVDHGVENIDAYAEYYRYVKSLQEEDMKKVEAGEKIKVRRPTPAVYSRLNCRDEFGRVTNGFPDHNGEYKPIPIYSEVDGEVVVCEETRKYMRKALYNSNSQGGVQSVRRYIGKDSKGRIVALPGYDHVNHGSTLGGTIQVVKTHGDLKHKVDHHVTCVPDINTYRVDPDEMIAIIIGSDGLWDFRWTHEVFECVPDDPDARTASKSIGVSTGAKASVPIFKTQGYSVTSAGAHGIRSSWDDVSWTVFLSKKKE